MTLFDNIEEQDTFNFDGMRQKLIDNLEMLKILSVEEQTLYNGKK